MDIIIFWAIHHKFWIYWVKTNSNTSEEMMTSIIWIQHSLVAELEKEVMAWNPRCLSASNQEPGLPQTCCRAMTKSHKWWCRCHFLWVGLTGVWRKRQCSWVHPKTSFQCHKLASALPGVSPHCHCLSAPFLTSKPIQTLICVMINLIKASEVYLQIV